MNIKPHWTDSAIATARRRTVSPDDIERRAQRRVRDDKAVRIGIRKPTDPINLARLKRWHERLREQAIHRERMGMRK